MFPAAGPWCVPGAATPTQEAPQPASEPHSSGFEGRGRIAGLAWNRRISGMANQALGAGRPPEQLNRRTAENLGRLRRRSADGISAATTQGFSVVALPLELPRRRLTWGDGPRSALRRCITLVDLRPFAAPCVGVPG